MRYGEMTAFEERPHSPYYGCADATPLYVVLLDEYERWTGDRSARARARASRRAPRSTGSTSTPTSRARATSGTSAATRRPASRTSAGRTPGTRSPYRDGRLPGLPAGDLRAAGLRLRREGARRPARARDLEGPGARRQAGEARPPTSSAASTATSGSRTASTSRSRSTPTASQVDALASNNGHLLWSGIVDKSKAKAVARHLLGPRLFSGWGVRTLAEGEGRYNPIGYHVGTVWPFDNSFIAWGLRRYGFKEEAAQIAAGILDAAEFFDGRLPEAFGGYDRDADEVPGAVPDRVQPAGLVDRHAAAAPADDARPRAASATTSSSIRRSRASIGHLELLDIPGRWGRIDAFGRGRVDVAKTQPVRTQPTPATEATARPGTQTGRRRRTT